MIKAIIFDCFGVLVADALKLICEELYERDPQGFQEVSDLIKANNLGVIAPAETNRQIAAIIGITAEEFKSRVAQGEVKDGTLMDYIAEELRPKYKTAILSNIAGTSLRRRFTPEELERCFDAVVASGDIGYAKPQPQAYQITADRLGVDPKECIFVDDREPFAQAARETGMQAICYTSFQQFKDDLKGMV